MPKTSTSRRSRFTIWHGIAASLLIHAAPAAPFVWYTLATPPDEPPTLVVELQGAIADSQTEQQVQQEIKGAAEQDKSAPPQPVQAPPAETAEQHPVDNPEAALPPPAPQPTEQKPQPPAEAKSAGTGVNTMTGTEQQQTAQTIQPDRPTEIELLRDYVKLLSKKVQVHLVYPDDGRRAGLQGTATVSFAILRSGEIRPETLKIVTSSGEPRLDASALKTIRASVPFDPAPKEMTVVIAVDFGRKR
ncbi:energy transducer TonB [Bradyrhizobium sp. HKCCYLS1011]|uniref:energy transducer TonB n=1 Tax=Bradyrhizobium sp. HKCCYLS1011 TaxID=3420733 RepID=UPI003EBE9833